MVPDPQCDPKFFLSDDQAITKDLSNVVELSIVISNESQPLRVISIESQPISYLSSTSVWVFPDSRIESSYKVLLHRPQQKNKK